MLKVCGFNLACPSNMCFLTGYMEPGMEHATIDCLPTFFVTDFSLGLCVFSSQSMACLKILLAFVLTLTNSFYRMEACVTSNLNSDYWFVILR